MAWILSSPSSASKESLRLLSKIHHVRATLDCGPPRPLHEWDSALTVRRPKPLIPLTTAPHRVSAISMSSFPAATMTRAARTTARASTGALIAITASETTSFVAKAFMRSFCDNLFFFSRRVVAPRTGVSLTRDVPLTSEPITLKVIAFLEFVDQLSCRLGLTRTCGESGAEMPF
jgi:hypothetical protein